MLNPIQVEYNLQSAEYYFATLMDQLVDETMQLEPVDCGFTEQVNQLFYTIEAVRFLVDRGIFTENPTCLAVYNLMMTQIGINTSLPNLVEDTTLIIPGIILPPPFQGPQGPAGPTGSQGVQGSQGPQGFQGFQGSGVQGSQGPIGPQGFQGNQGPTGPQGFQGSGVQGSQGAQGSIGPQGFQGTQGFQGSGVQGVQGPQGAIGPQGFQGTQGFQGSGVQGVQGPQGFQGFQGNTGATGPQGDTGATGSTGPQGAPGAQGSTGAQGATGATGPQGDTGAQGPTGPQGTQGPQGFQGTQGPGVSGTTNNVAKFTSSTAIGNSLMVDNGTTVAITKTSAGTIVQGYTTGNQGTTVGTGASVDYYLNNAQAARAIAQISSATFIGTDYIIENRNSGEGSLTENMRINAAGNVLIGSATDNSTTAKLQVTGGISYLNIFNRQTASYTLVLTDQSKIVEMNVGSANNLTVPLNSSQAFPIGTEIQVLQYGAGQTTIVATSGVTLRSKSGQLKIGNQYTGVTLVKVGTDEWYVIGNVAA